MAKKAATSQLASSRIFDDVLALASTLLRNRKDLGADKLHSLAQATREYATALSDLPNLKAQAASASESIEGLADYVMHTDVENMAADASNFARRHPMATLGMTIAAGYLASRMMRPAASRRAPTPRRGASRKKAKAPIHARRSANGSAQPHA